MVKLIESPKQSRKKKVKLARIELKELLILVSLEILKKN